MSSQVNGGADDRTIILKNVRLAFPDLYVPKQFQGTGDPRYSCSLLLEPGSENDKAVQAAILSAANAKWEKKAPAALQTIVGQSQKYCYVDGNTRDYDGFAGMMALSANRPAKSGPPKLIDRDKSELTEASGKPYGGCYVNAKVQIWAQDNEYGKGMRCTLIALQFSKDGDAFGGTGPANDEGLEAVEDEAMDLV